MRHYCRNAALICSFASAVNDASDTEARTEMCYAAMLAGIAFNAAGCHLPHGLSYPVSAQTQN